MLEQLLQPVSLVLLAIIIMMAILLVRLWMQLDKHKQEEQKHFANELLRTPTAQRLEEADKRFLGKADEALRLTQTFQKFVPRQFVDHFAKHGTDTLELGHADEDDVAILFCDIRGFTGLSEKMTPQELMKFLNSYFLRMNDPIHQNGGFIDKFIGDAIMALFDHPDGEDCDKAKDAIHAAIDLRYALNVYNQHRQNSGYPPINIGVGIHFGPVIIGTVGSDDRMDTTVIGDSVNIAHRLEALAPKFGADIIVSAQLLDTAKAKGQFAYRVLDWVRVKGRKTPLEIYEILDHLPKQDQQHKLATAQLISDGIQARIKQDWLSALELFQQALVISPKDPLIIHHMEQCHRLQSVQAPENWDGALSV